MQVIDNGVVVPFELMDSISVKLIDRNHLIKEGIVKDSIVSGLKDIIKYNNNQIKNYSKMKNNSDKKEAFYKSVIDKRNEKHHLEIKELKRKRIYAFGIGFSIGFVACLIAM